jgi:hypothetical protein
MMLMTLSKDFVSICNHLTCFILMFLCNANLIITFADHKMVLSTWGMMYCGGSKPVENTLRQISRVYNISLHPESFAW